MKNNGPFIKSKTSNFEIMQGVMVVLLVIFSASLIKFNIIPFINGDITLLSAFKPIINLVVVCLTSVIVEAIYYYFTDKSNLKLRLKNSFPILPGMFLCLIVPYTTPLYMLVIAISFGVLFGKLLFGGFGKNIFNPALLAYLYIFVNNPASLKLDGITSPTPLTAIANTGIVNNFDKVLSDNSLFDVFIGNINGAFGEVSALLIILGFIYLVYKGYVKYQITFAYLITVFFISLCIGLLNGLSPIFGIYNIFIGGLLFGACFMAVDPVTSCVDKRAMYVYGMFLGILTCIFRFTFVYPEGVMISILIGNIFVHFFDDIALKHKKYMPYLILLMIVSLLLSIMYINSTLNKKEDTTNEEINPVKILETKIDGDSTIYTVSNYGYVSDIILDVKVNNNTITSIEVVSENDSYFGEIYKNNYFDTIIENQSNIGDVDTISGATYSSKAILDEIKEVLNKEALNE